MDVFLPFKLLQTFVQNGATNGYNVICNKQYKRGAEMHSATLSGKSEKENIAANFNDILNVKPVIGKEIINHNKVKNEDSVKYNPNKGKCRQYKE